VSTFGKIIKSHEFTTTHATRKLYCLINSRVIPNSPHLPFEIFSCLISRSYDLLFCAKPDINLMGDCINGTIHMPLCVAKNSKNSAEFATEVTRKTTFYRILDHAKNKMQKIRVFFVWQM
jgi:hypothetical protein